MVEENKPEEKSEGDKPEEKKESSEGDSDPEEPASSPLLDETKKTVSELNKATEEMKIERKKMEKVSSDLALQGKGLMAKPDSKTPEEIETNRRVKEIGNATGAAWAEKM